MQKQTVGFALCGSFCTFKKVIPQMKKLADEGYRVIPIMSHTAYTTDTRFGKSRDFNEEIEQICKEKIIYTISGAEPIGPKQLLDVLVIAPCTGNTLGKLSNGMDFSSISINVSGLHKQIIQLRLDEKFHTSYFLPHSKKYTFPRI